MITEAAEKHQITINGQVVEVVRKAIKNLHLGVYRHTVVCELLHLWQ